MRSLLGPWFALPAFAGANRESEFRRDAPPLLDQAYAVHCAAAEIGHVEFACFVLAEGTDRYVCIVNQRALCQPPAPSGAAAQMEPLQ